MQHIWPGCIFYLTPSLRTERMRKRDETETKTELLYFMRVVYMSKSIVQGVVGSMECQGLSLAVGCEFGDEREGVFELGSSDVCWGRWS